jgi:hypothetical protein
MKAYKFEMSVVCEKLEQTLKWREEVDFAAIKAAVKSIDPNNTETYPQGKIIAKYYPQWFLTNANPIFCLLIAKLARNSRKISMGTLWDSHVQD